MAKYASVKSRPKIKESTVTYQGKKTGHKKVKIGDKELDIYNGFQNPEAYEDYEYAGKTYKVRKDVRAGLERLIAAAKADGIDMPMTSSFRDYDRQVKTKAQSVAKGTGSKAAAPGHSRHGFGEAFDFTDSRYNTNRPTTQNYRVTPTYAWLADNAHKYGFIAPQEMYANPKTAEPWHYEYYSEYDPHTQQVQQVAVAPRPVAIAPSVIPDRNIDYSTSLAGGLAKPQQYDLASVLSQNIRKT
jgi:LAS superfamily LD-carboxypeptidase LdcB